MNSSHRALNRRAIILVCVLVVGSLTVVTTAGATVASEDGPAVETHEQFEAPEVLCRASDNGDKYGHAGSEVWGPTDLNSQISNQRLVVGTNQKGTVTLFKYPSPSYSDQIKHHAFDRREDYYGSDPNAGAFLGAVVTKEDGTKEVTWFREWGPVSTTDPEYGDHVNQTWLSEYSDTLVTEFSNDELGLDVKITNVVPKENDVFVRDVEVKARDGSPVEDVELVSYENFNLVDDKDSLAPTQDWCSEGENSETAEYDGDTDAVLHHTPTGPWYEDGAEFSVATAMAFEGESTQHQVAGDDFSGDNPDDPYKLLSDGDVNLPGDDSFTGQTSVAMTKDLNFEDGQGSARVYFAAAHDDEPNKDLSDEAANKIQEARDLSLQNEIQKKEDWFRKYVEDAPMPQDAPEDVRKVARRSLVSIVQLWDNETVNEHGFSGNLPAAVTTQPPYGADWIRDGAYFDYIIDRYMSGDGRHDWVNQHNRWYMSLQQNPDGPCPEHCHDNMEEYNFADLVPQVSSVPEGGWAMNYYGDGAVAGPIGGEIDETAYGAWTFWDHYAVTGNETYLQRIYPAIQKVGDRLTYDCVDEDTGLQCPRPEDDNTKKTQTIIGGASAHAGLSAATKAAAEMYEITGDETYADEARAYAERRDELGQAIEKNYWDENGGYYGKKKGGPSPRVGMPAFLRPYDDPRMQNHMESMWENVDETFQGNLDQGQYEAKTLIGLGLAAQRAEDPPVEMEKIRDGLKWIASEHARDNSTYIMGEAWVRETYADGEVDSAQGQPHTWEQGLFYLSSLIAYGEESARDDMGKDVYEEWRNNDAELTGLSVDSGVYTEGDTVDATVTVNNDAEVSQDYFVRYTVEGPNGETTAEEKTVGPISTGGSQEVTLTWSAGTVSGDYDATVSVWKAQGDPAVEPTALSDASYRHTELDSVSESSAFEISPPPADASFDYSPSSPDTDDTVQFTDTSEGDITSWSWDFGDGATSSQQNPSHSYSSSGTYTVELQITDSNGNTDTATTTVDVDSSGWDWWPFW
jgi:GH15 family glucan-1,4-alpha-glucosidase